MRRRAAPTHYFAWMVFVTTLLLMLGSVVQAQQTVTFWSSGFAETAQEWMQQTVVPAFAAKHGAKVEYAEIGWGAGRTEKLATAHAGGVAPDVFVNGDYLMSLPLDKYVATWADQKQISKVFWDQTRDKVHNAWYNVPFTADLRGIGYNRRLFAEAGLSETPPNSWEDFVGLVRRLTRYDDAGKTVQSGYETNWHNPSVQTDYDWFLKQTGIEPQSSDLRRSNFNTQEALDTVKFFVEVFQITHPQLGLWTTGIYPQSFGQGIIAMSLANVGALRWIREVDPAEEAYLGVFAPRRHPDSTPVAISTVNGLAISSQSRDPDLAWRFVEFLMSREHQAGFAPLSDHLVIRNDVSSNRSLPRIREAAPWYDIMPYVRLNNILGDLSVWTKYLVDAMEGRRCPEDAWNNMYHEHQLALDNYWKQ